MLLPVHLVGVFSSASRRLVIGLLVLLLAGEERLEHWILLALVIHTAGVLEEISSVAGHRAGRV